MDKVLINLNSTKLCNNLGHLEVIERDVKSGQYTQSQLNQFRKAVRSLPATLSSSDKQFLHQIVLGLWNR